MQQNSNEASAKSRIKNRMKLKRLIELLQKLPPESRVWTCGIEGINPVEGGNLCPIKILKTKWGLGIYIDDGLTWFDDITKEWIPLDEFVELGEDKDGKVNEKIPTE